MLASVVYIFTGSAAILIVWEAISIVYLVGGFVLARRHSRAGDPDRGRKGALDTLSWILPFVASLVGLYSAIVLLVTRLSTGNSQIEDILFAVLTSLGIVVSWHLLHAGFAQVYELAYNRDPTTRPLGFPGRSTPTRIDFLYFAFTIGASFATSDTAVKTPRMRGTVLLHAVISFFYNALVVATAFQVIQRLAA